MTDDGDDLANLKADYLAAKQAIERIEGLFRRSDKLAAWPARLLVLAAKATLRLGIWISPSVRDEPPEPPRVHPKIWGL
jgi:hypothetical protein